MQRRRARGFDEAPAAGARHLAKSGDAHGSTPQLRSGIVHEAAAERDELPLDPSGRGF
jgi:hypothetical protein